MRISVVLVAALLIGACEGPKALNTAAFGTTVALQQASTTPDPLVPRGLFEPAEATLATTPQVDNFPTSTPDNPRPLDQLPSNTLATFDPAKPATLDVHDRFYTQGDCVQYSCQVTLWPDNAKVWVLREYLGLPRFEPTPITKFVAFTPVPTPAPPPCATFNGPQGSVTVCGWGDLNAEGQAEYIRQFGGALAPDATAAPAQCSACPAQP